MVTRPPLQRFLYVWGWRARHAIYDTRAGQLAYLLALLVLCGQAAWLGWGQVIQPVLDPAAPQQAFVWWVQLIIMVVAAIVSIALMPKPKDAERQTPEVPLVEDGADVHRVYGEVWLTDPVVLGWKQMGTANIRGKKSGFSGRPIVGYNYNYLLHFGLCRGPVDAFVEFRAGDRVAWNGGPQQLLTSVKLPLGTSVGNIPAGTVPATGALTQSGQIRIAAANLWGGDKKEGGIVGDMDVMFGEETQMPNSFLATNLGPLQGAYRGKLTVVFRGGRWGSNPYPKPPAFKVRRIFKGWDGDVCWYPETAAIGAGGFLASAASLYISMDVSGSMGGAKLTVLKQAMQKVIDTLQIWKESSTYPLNVKFVAFSGSATQIEFMSIADSQFDDLRSFVDLLVAGGGTDAPAAYGGAVGFFDAERRNNALFCISDGDMSGVPSARSSIAHFLDKENPPNCLADGTAVGVFGVGIGTVGSLETFNNTGQPVPVISGADPDELANLVLGALGGEIQADGLVAMNPAHILYDSITSLDMGAEPAASVSDTSFRVAADRLHAEGFGLCTLFSPSTESVEQFQQRICNTIGGALSRDPADGLWYLDLIRGDYTLADLPILTDDDILDFEEEPSTLDNAINQVVVEWFDPIAKEGRSTAPLQALGAIQSYGGVLSQTKTYREIPTEPLALRVGARDLRSSATPLRRFNVKTTRVSSRWRLARPFRIQAPKRGIADMVCLLLETDAGTLRSGAVQLKAVQDVFGMPMTTYVQPMPGVPSGAEGPGVPPAERVFEAPYIELLDMLLPGDISALPVDAGFLLSVAAPPAVGLDYAMVQQATDGSFDILDESTAWSPSTPIAAAAGKLDTALVAADLRYLPAVSVGTAALWGNEIVRVDAIDAATGAITVARGCADTVPAAHPANERLWFYDAYNGQVDEMFTAGQTVNVKLLTNTASQQLAPDLAATLSLTFTGRAARPYPPARVTFAGELYPAATLSVTGDVEITWATRDRVTQGNQLIDALHASILPDPLTRYAITVYNASNVQVVSRGDISGVAATVRLPVAGTYRIEVYAINDYDKSMQTVKANVSITPAGGVTAAEIIAPIWTRPGTIIDGGEVTI
ncbi:MAG: vWA domain-containing protein [Stenotrophomonas sp.]